MQQVILKKKKTCYEVASAVQNNSYYWILKNDIEVQ